MRTMRKKLPKGKCISDSQRKCMNCNGTHASTYKQCPIRKQLSNQNQNDNNTIINNVHSIQSNNKNQQQHMTDMNNRIKQNTNLIIDDKIKVANFEDTINNQDKSLQSLIHRIKQLEDKNTTVNKQSTSTNIQARLNKIENKINTVHQTSTTKINKQELRITDINTAIVLTESFENIQNNRLTTLVKYNTSE